MFWILILVIILILETPLVFKLIKAHKNFDITREVAIVILMIIIALIVLCIFSGVVIK